MGKFIFSFLVLSFFISSKSYAVLCTGHFFKDYSHDARLSYAAGVWDSIEYLAATGDKAAQGLVKCVGPDVRMSQLADILKGHFEKHPALRDTHCYPAMVLLIDHKFECNVGEKLKLDEKAKIDAAIKRGLFSRSK